MKNVVSCRNITFEYENGVGIYDISYDLSEGDIVAIVGRSGSGKTTIINTTLGIIEATSGTVVYSDNFNMKDMSFSPQFQAIDWYLNVWDNVFMGALFSGIKDKKKRTAEVLDMVGLTQKIKSDPTELSGGELQRLQLARQFIDDAKLLVLDEPTSSLDIENSEKILKELKLRVDNGACCLISSHDLELLEKYCNKILFIEDGHQLYFGEMSDFLKIYNSAKEFSISTFEDFTADIVSDIKQFSQIIERDTSRIIVQVKNQEDLNRVLTICLDNHLSVTELVQNTLSLKDILLTLNHS